MAKIDTDRLKAALPLETLIERCGVELKKKGQNDLIGLCPFHSENTPSFTVTPAKQAYYCMGCGAGGDHISFLQSLYSEDFRQSAERLQDIVGGDFSISDFSPVQRESIKTETVPVWVQSSTPVDIPAPVTISVNRGGQFLYQLADSPCPASVKYFDSQAVLKNMIYTINLVALFVAVCNV